MIAFPHLSIPGMTIEEPVLGSVIVKYIPLVGATERAVLIVNIDKDGLYDVIMEVLTEELPIV